MYLLKKVYAVYNGVWCIAPDAGEFSRIFVSKVTFNGKLQKKNWGAGCTRCSPIIYWGTNYSPCSPGSHDYAKFSRI